MIRDSKTGKLWSCILCEVSENNYWITPDRNVGFVVSPKEQSDV